MADIVDTLRSLSPDANWVVSGDVIRWDSPDITQPTEAEITAEITRLTEQEPWVKLREERNRRLSETDWWALADQPAMTDAQVSYRTALRNLPANTTDPTNPVWPTKPE